MALVNHFGGYDMAMPCGKIENILLDRDSVLALYPECQTFYTGPKETQETIVSVRARVSGGQLVEVVEKCVTNTPQSLVIVVDEPQSVQAMIWKRTHSTG
ncbi:hypothetical protein F4780DRAFT_249840 [Xylariomycetidae sp. FL0641]|nr:hypothetical protein F4780DRAFT_249840 [Xylariomycetidae sp. FL0641]